MHRVRQFELNTWIDAHENHETLDMSTTVSSPPLSIDALVELSTDPEATKAANNLRESIASLYTNPQVTREHVITTSGAVAANHIIFSGLICPGDHIICMYPVYEQLYKISQALGAEKFAKNTKMIVLCNPNNPTGAYLSSILQNSVLELAQSHDIILMVDEVFRPMFHSLPNGEEEPVSFLESGYEKCVVTGSCSKSYGIPGIRVGWIATLSNDFLARFTQLRNYTTISVGQIDESIAIEALSARCRQRLIQRSLDMAQVNLTFLAQFVAEHPQVTWADTYASTSTLIRLHYKDGRPLHDQQFALKLLKAYNILFCPASLCFEEYDQGSLQGYLRLAFVTGIVEAEDEGGKEEGKMLVRVKKEFSTIFIEF
ncbi:hypothetical protein ASPFODRAFT_86068 [Aspergillus luchuensis CBS 106.47]|uniref:Aminotransferase class I/classII large domain-containing protein n=1 Tax=Aspergillus luchuensis (strain CBS 106.47) TaxID=1137211 RepID=A0A1M3SYR4_ASPLC|nr:hypothetical protein ASPFODRAFT_86068 [Aspergillus luchuensis CBS 106.47]